MKIGDLVSFKHGSVGVPRDSLGLIVGEEEVKTMEKTPFNVPSAYFVYRVVCHDGRIRKFTDSYLKEQSNK